MEKVVVDGSNVAFEELDDKGRPKLANVLQMRDRLKERGFDPVVFVDADLRHYIDDRKGLEALLDNEILQAPADTEADFFILKTAELESVKIVSNDLFNKYRDEFPWVRDRRVPFMIVDGKVELYPNLQGARPEEKHHTPK